MGSAGESKTFEWSGVFHLIISTADINEKQTMRIVGMGTYGGIFLPTLTCLACFRLRTGTALASLWFYKP